MDQQNQNFDNIREELKRLIKQSENQNPDLTLPADDQKNQIATHFDSNIHPDTTTPYSIDEGIQKIRSELKESCQLFQTAGEAFESINFNSLKHRIRDLHLTASQSEMDVVMEEKNVDQKLNKLTNIMGYKFRQHPGEFGDIPELSSFFKACSQLQHGLEKLKRHRCEMDELGNQTNLATNESRQRIEEIQKILKKD
ncbi:uncharacterized protein LOC129913806 [Episyrphus balteatus]|uniref:uncharacterized protein LOC129913806 n=1 Tax=Episyrphus balteatus TaxID=286459 RepID=UPI0024865E7B|nr:uncharacterized protein LOC129913806 [Episyrphus balteatus]